MSGALTAAQALAHRHPGLRVEPKLAAVAVHYRHAPELEPLCREVLADAVAQSAGLELMAGKCVLEVKPVRINKGRAIEIFMAEAPFAGRRPLFAGDDVTDEAGFATVQRLGGLGLKVGLGPSAAQYHCGSPQALRSWLHFSIGRISAACAARKFE